MLRRAATNAYTWWWASHIRTKQSKWLEQSLQDMEEKVAETLKIVDDDGESFSQRAEMYYRKRPLLVEFVEEAFRAFRALAERYDHISRQLQTANHTIATVFPEQVYYGIDEDDEEESFPGSNSPHQDSNNQTPRPGIPNAPNYPKKNFRSPSMMLSRKGPLRRIASSAKSTPISSSSGLSKVEALAEVDKLQKEILALQTEKEFVRSSYEHSYEKYWEIEDHITGMQKKIYSLQDEFGIGRVIEDNEARALMAATALNSCKETLAKLQEVQTQSSEEAKAAYQRVKEAHGKFEVIRDQFISKHSSEEDQGTEPKGLEEEMVGLDEEMHEHDAGLWQDMVKKKLEEDSGDSFTMTEIAEGIDELVSKVVALETAVSSQSGLVKRLKSETDELQKTIISLEEDKEALIEDSEETKKKLKELEEELRRVKSLNRSVKRQDNNLRTSFTEASCNLDHLSGKLNNVKLDEEGENFVLYKNRSEPDEEQKEESEKQNEPDKELLYKNRSEPYEELLNKNRSEPDEELLNKNRSESDEELLNESRSEPDEELLNKNRSEPDEELLNKNRSEPDEELFNKNQSAPDEELKEESEKPGNILSTGNLAIMNDIETTKEEKEDYDANLNDIRNEDHDESNLKENIDLRTDGISELKIQDNGDLSGARGNLHTESPDQGTGEEEEQPNWRQMFVSGLDDREKVLLEEYTSILKDYKDVRIKLNDAVKKNQDSIFELSLKVRELKDVIAAKNKEIEFLQQKLTSKQTNRDESPCATANLHLHVRELKDVIATKNKEIDILQQKLTSPQTNREESPCTTANLHLNVRELKDVIATKNKEIDILQQKLSKPQAIQDESPCATANLHLHVRELKDVIATKNKEIDILQQKLTSPQTNWDESPCATPTDCKSTPQHAFLQITAQGTNTQDPKGNPSSNTDASIVSTSYAAQQQHLFNTRTIGMSPGKTIFFKLRAKQVGKSHSLSSLEKKFRSDIDNLLEQNLEFWLRFSTSVHQIQKFQNNIQDLRAELRKIKDENMSQVNLTFMQIKPIFRHLREIRTELSLWLEHNEVLHEELHGRHPSLCTLQDEIARAANPNSPSNKVELSGYQAAKFQGEVLHMKQENNKAYSELQASVSFVKRLKSEVEKMLEEVGQEIGVNNHVNGQDHMKHSTTRTRVPLRSYLFGIKLKKQRQSGSPSQANTPKQSGDLTTAK